MPNRDYNNLLKVSSFAIKKGVSRNHIYDLIREGEIETEDIEGTVYIDWERYKEFDVLGKHDEYRANQEKLSSAVETLKKKVRHLEHIIFKSGNFGPSANAPS